MKLSRNVMLGFLVLGLSLSMSGVSFAHENEAEFVKLLQSSAAALQTSQPALSADLTAFANEEAAEEKGEKKEDEKKEKEERNTPERMARRIAHLKLLRDSAAALQASHPDLALKLTKRADRNAKRMAEKKLQTA